MIPLWAVDESVSEGMSTNKKKLQNEKSHEWCEKRNSENNMYLIEQEVVVVAGVSAMGLCLCYTHLVSPLSRMVLA